MPEVIWLCSMQYTTHGPRKPHLYMSFALYSTMPATLAGVQSLHFSRGCACACIPCCCSARPKLIDEAPPITAEGQAPVCLWQAAGTRFSVSIKLARPLYEPWQPPAQPSRQLQDLFPPRAPPPPPPALTAADRLRAKVGDSAGLLWDLLGRVTWCYST